MGLWMVHTADRRAVCFALHIQHAMREGRTVEGNGRHVRRLYVSSVTRAQWQAQIAQARANTYRPRHRKNEMRVWEIAQKVGVPSKEALRTLRECGAPVKSAGSRVPITYAMKYIDDTL